MNVRLLRLQTGEDLLADVVINENGDYVLENPCMVYVRPNSTNTGASIGLTRWLPYASKKNITLEKRWIVVDTEPEDDLRNEYNKAFGSGIVIAPQGLTVN